MDSAEVLPEFRGIGIGTALTDELEALARAEGKTKLLTYTPIATAPGARLDSPRGSGPSPPSDVPVAITPCGTGSGPPRNSGGRTSQEWRRA